MCGGDAAGGVGDELFDLPVDEGADGVADGEFAGDGGELSEDLVGGELPDFEGVELLDGDEPVVEPVFDVVAGVGDFVGEVSDLGLEGRLGKGFGRGGWGAWAVEGAVVFAEPFEDFP